MPSRAAFLPPLVEELVCNERDFSLRPSATQNLPLPSFLDDHGLLSIEATQHCLPQAVINGPVTTAINPRDLDSFKKACTIVMSELPMLPVDQLITLGDVYSDQLSWLGTPGKKAAEIWLRLYEKGNFDQAWLVGSTVLEQLLGNIIFSLQKPDKFIPFLVRDLVAVPCLTKCIDRTLIRILKTMIGSPLTLNIRNLLWHGFIIPGDEIPLDAYGAMLIVTTMTIIKDAKAKLAGLTLAIRHLHPKSYYFGPQLQASLADDFDHVFERVAFGPNPPPLPHLAEILQALIMESKFVTSGTVEQWSAACQHLESGSDSSFVFVMSSLPLVEHALRLVYVAVNQCKEDRRNALIDGEYYLTLDVILDKFVPVDYYDSGSSILNNYDSSSIPNKLPTELGTEVMNLLNDLFLLDLGPRLRDRTSHGELNSYLTVDITKEPWFACYIGLVIRLLSKYMSSDTRGLSEEIEQNNSWIAQYSTCRFNEWSTLKKEASRCQALLSKYSEWLASSNPTVGDNPAESTLPVELILRFKDASVFSNEESILRAPLEHQLRATLSSWSAEKPEKPAFSAFATNLPAWIIILQGIQEAIQRVVAKVTTLSEQLAKHQLSSRSRKQFEVMRPLIPRFLGMLVGCLTLVEHFVLTPSACASPATFGGVLASTSCPDSLSARRNISSALEAMTISEPSTPRPSTTSTSSSTGATQLIDRSSSAEIQLRLKLTTFVDKFVSNFDRAKLSMIEPAWEDLLKNVGILEGGRQEGEEQQQKTRWLAEGGVEE
ncbi:hypothetical protein EDD21DRAFT_440472 [Dissophora ornata]|nr:hypothetical protein EDD21DRAFT_440472 [Dissophora ornata]